MVGFAHHPDVFFGIFMIFLGLVTLGSLQEYWLKPLISGMTDAKLFFGATALTAITDHAALTYLGSLVEGTSDEQKYALVAGGVTGGGLTAIANAPILPGSGFCSQQKCSARTALARCACWPEHCLRR